MKHSILPIYLGMALAVTATNAAELNSDKEKLSYALGFQIGQSLKSDGMEVDPKIIAEAIEDVMLGAQPALSMNEMQQAVQTFQQQENQKRQSQAMDNREAGEQFRARHRQQDGVEVLDSGIQYKVLEEGSGDKPKADDQVTVNYEGRLVTGEVFDSSYERGQPATFSINQVIEGWQDILPKMRQGAKWEVVLPPEKAYGDQGAGNTIGPGETLIFDIELKEIQ